MPRTSIQDTFERVHESFEHISVSWGEPPEGWVLSSDLVRDPVAVERMLHEVGDVYQMDDRRVAANFLVMAYSWHLMTGAIACFFLDARVPDLSASAVAVDVRGGAVFSSPRFLALPDDPASTDPEATVVGCRHELRIKMVRSLEEQHASPLFATLRSVAPLGVHAMRANYVDRLASVILWLADQIPDDDLARQEVPLFVNLAGPKDRTGLTEIEHNGRTRLFLRRGGCCLNYQLPGRERCITCCLHTVEEREHLLRQHLSDTQ